MAGRRFSRRAYQKLLAACPEEFQREHGPQMEQAFGDLCREERYGGPTGLAKLWFRAFPDLAWTVVVERKTVARALPTPQNFYGTSREVFFSPVNFFSRLPRSGGYLVPLLFALICGQVCALLGGLFAYGGLVEYNPRAYVLSVLLAPFGVAISVFLAAAIIHFFLKLLLRSDSAGYQATFRVCCYSSVVYLAMWIGIIELFASLYGLYLGVVGVREVHSTTTKEAAFAVLILPLVSMLMVIAGAIVFRTTGDPLLPAGELGERVIRILELSLP